MSQFLEMKIFVKIVEAGTITKAADQLGIAKSAISRRLSELEQRLGVHLIIRTTRSSKLTEMGRRYYEQSIKILSELSELEAEISDKKSYLGGSLNIAVPFSFGLLQLGDVIEEFMTLNPDLIVKIHFSDQQVDLVEGGFDLAIRIAKLKDSTHIIKKFAPVRLLICASPDYFKGKSLPQHPSDLKKFQGLHYSYTSGTSWRFEHVKTQETISVKVPTKMIANNGDFLLEMALAGHGIALLPSFIASKKIKSGELMTLFDDFQIPSINAYLVYPQTYHLPQKVRSFIDFLSEYFAGIPPWDVDLI